LILGGIVTLMRDLFFLIFVCDVAIILTRERIDKSTQKFCH